MEHVEHDFAKVDGVRLHWVAAGPEDGRLVVFLHGFPEFWYGWRKQIPYFAARGYRVVAPDQRGYALSDKPQGVGEYSYDKLGDDVVRLVRAQGRERALIVGHDWGAAVAWWLAANRPEICEKVAILNVARPDILWRAVRAGGRQLLRSWYVGFFQLPEIPERMLRARRYALLRRALVRSSRPGTFSADDLERYVGAWSEPGALTAMVNWYRAAGRSAALGAKARFAPIEVPLHVAWGTEDKFLGRELAERSLTECACASMEYVDGATHWVQHDEPERVNAALERFFDEEARATRAG